jgi:hypothetical protein
LSTSSSRTLQKTKKNKGKKKQTKKKSLKKKKKKKKKKMSKLFVRVEHTQGTLNTEQFYSSIKRWQFVVNVNQIKAK